MKVFKEEQRFTQPWLIVLMVVCCIVPFVLLIQKYQKNTDMSLQKLITTLTIIILANGILFLFKLKTRIDEKGIHYHFFPFHFKTKIITWNEITSAHVRTYDAIGEYGGWGLKGGFLWNKEKGKAINVSGDVGIQLELKNGKKILIGTQEELKLNLF